MAESLDDVNPYEFEIGEILLYLRFANQEDSASDSSVPTGLTNGELVAIRRHILPSGLH